MSNIKSFIDGYIQGYYNGRRSVNYPYIVKLTGERCVVLGQTISGLWEVEFPNGNPGWFTSDELIPSP